MKESDTSILILHQLKTISDELKEIRADTKELTRLYYELLAAQAVTKTTIDELKIKDPVLTMGSNGFMKQIFKPVNILILVGVLGFAEVVKVQPSEKITAEVSERPIEENPR